VRGTLQVQQPEGRGIIGKEKRRLRVGAIYWDDLVSCLLRPVEYFRVGIRLEPCLWLDMLMGDGD
jgi:hypothetical protein